MLLLPVTASGVGVSVIFDRLAELLWKSLTDKTIPARWKVEYYYAGNSPIAFLPASDARQIDSGGTALGPMLAEKSPSELSQ